MSALPLRPRVVPVNVTANLVPGSRGSFHFAVAPHEIGFQPESRIPAQFLLQLPEGHADLYARHREPAHLPFPLGKESSRLASIRTAPEMEMPNSQPLPDKWTSGQQSVPRGTRRVLQCYLCSDRKITSATWTSRKPLLYEGLSPPDLTKTYKLPTNRGRLPQTAGSESLFHVAGSFPLPTLEAMYTRGLRGRVGVQPRIQRVLGRLAIQATIGSPAANSAICRSVAAICCARRARTVRSARSN